MLSAFINLNSNLNSSFLAQLLEMRDSICVLCLIINDCIILEAWWSFNIDQGIGLVLFQDFVPCLSGLVFFFMNKKKL